MSTEGLAIEYVDLAEIRKWPGNPKPHDVPAAMASIRAFGFRDPIGANRRTRMIEEGHGRDEALILMRDGGEAPPRFVRLGADGAWQVPVLWFDDDDQTAARYALAHNRVWERGGAPDDTAVLAALAMAQLESDAALIGTGYDAAWVTAQRQAEADRAHATGEVVFAEELDEENNYVVLFFRTRTDWLNLLTLLGLESTYAKRRNGKAWSKGLGRVVDGPSALAKIQAGG